MDKLKERIIGDINNRSQLLIEPNNICFIDTMATQTPVNQLTLEDE